MNTNKALQIKTIDITAKEWFDRVNGNSYFSASIVLNFGLPDAEELKIPFEYGYGDFYIQKALEKLKILGYTTVNHTADLRDHGIILRTQKIKNCKKRELMQ